MVDIFGMETEREVVLPTRVVKVGGRVKNAERLLDKKDLNVNFYEKEYTEFVSGEEKSYVVLDFGRELHGGIYVSVCSSNPKSNIGIRLTFGESVSEALSDIGGKNATNDHSPRDFEVKEGLLSGLEFGQTGFRFVRLMLLDEGSMLQIKSVVAVCKTQKMSRAGYFRTDDEQLNKIIDTAVYTCKLNFQNGVIWDGIKRDRLVWAGDLNAEILTSSYAFGALPNIKNSLELVKNCAGEREWINKIPSYSAWWALNLFDYYKFSGAKHISVKISVTSTLF